MAAAVTIQTAKPAATMRISQTTVKMNDSVNSVQAKGRARGLVFLSVAELRPTRVLGRTGTVHDYNVPPPAWVPTPKPLQASSGPRPNLDQPRS